MGALRSPASTCAGLRAAPPRRARPNPATYTQFPMQLYTIRAGYTQFGQLYTIRIQLYTIRAGLRGAERVAPVSWKNARRSGASSRTWIVRVSRPGIHPPSAT